MTQVMKKMPAILLAGCIAALVAFAIGAAGMQISYAADEPDPSNNWHDVTLNPGDTYDTSKASANTTVHITKAGDYTLKGKSSKVRVTITSGGVRVFLADGLDLDCSALSNIGVETAPINIGLDNDPGGTITLISKKNANVFFEGYMCPGIRKEGTKTELVFETEDPDAPGTITVNSGSTDLNRDPAAIGSMYSDTGNITFNSGNIIATIRGINSCAAAIGSGDSFNASNITINGGNIKAKGSETGAAIGAGANGVFSGFTVNGGTVYAESGGPDVTELYEAPAIGGGCYNFGSEEYPNDSNIGAKDFYFNGGTVTAKSHGPAAAIGGGTNSGCSNLNINGGTISATCNSKHDYFNGAGIGGGYGYKVNTDIKISGGFITAQGGKLAPGIGSQDSDKNIHYKPKDPDTGTISISGGTIYAGCGSGARGDIGTRKSKMIVTGGNLHALSHAGDAVNGDGDDVHRVEISFDGITDDGHAISNLGFTPKDYPYGMTDVVTLSGKLHAWLPSKNDMDLTRAYLDSNGTKQKYGGAIPFSANAGTLYPGVRITLIPNVTDYTPGSAWGIPGATALEDMIPPIFSKKGYKPGRFTKGTNKQVAEADGTLIANVADYTDEDGKWIYSASNEATLYGSLKPITYNVKFDANVPKNASTKCSGSMADQSFKYGYAQTLTKNGFELPGYRFDGWYLNPEGTGQKFNDTQSININNQDYLAPEKDGATVTLYAQWKPKTYTINFTSKFIEGTQIIELTEEQKDVEFDNPGTLKKVADMRNWRRDGYSFHGWVGPGFGSFYDDGAPFCNLCGKPDASGNLSDVTLTGEWVANETIMVSVTKDGVPQAGLYDQKGLAPYLFLTGEDGDNAGKPIYGLFKKVGSADPLDPAGSIKYIFDPKDHRTDLPNGLPPGDYLLCFDTRAVPDEGIPEGPTEYVAGSVEITYGGAYGISTVFDYYTVGIKADSSYGAIKSVMISDEGGLLQPSQDKTIFAPAGYELLIETVMNEGYHFDGYSAIGVAPIWEEGNPEKAKQKIEVMGTADIMAHGAPNVYTVKFDPNATSGVSGTMKDQDMVWNEPQHLFANQFKRIGGTFKGWNTKKDGSGTGIADGVEVENLTKENGGTVTLYAQWNMEEYDITYDLDGGALPGGASNPATYTAASPTFTLNNPVKEDYDFVGWLGTGLTKPTEEVTIKECSTGDRRYDAQWALKHFYVKFVTNGGSKVETQRIAIHGKATKPEDPTRKGYTFAGWYADKDLTQPFDFGTKIEKDTTVYARWKEIPVIDTAPVASAITYGQTLSSSTLSGEAKASGKVVDGTFTWTDPQIKPDISDSGKTEYDVIFTPSDTENYESAATKARLTVNKVDIHPTVSIEGWVYGSASNTPSVDPATNPGNGKVTFQYKKKGAADSTYTDKVPTEAGAYTVKAEVAETAYYKSGTATLDFTISPADMQVTSAGYNGVYDGAKHSITVSAPDGATVEYSKDKGKTYSAEKPAFAKAGAYPVDFRVTLKNYKEYKGTETVVISPAAITITADGKKSNAGEALKKLTYTVSGAYVKGDDLGVKLSTDAKKDKPGVYKIKVSWNENPDYEATLINGTYTVVKKPAPKPQPKPHVNKAAARTQINASLKAISSGAKVTASWGKVKGASSYVVYATYCNQKKFSKVKTVSSRTTQIEITKIAGKKFNPKKNIKFYVVAYQTVNGKKVRVAKSIMAHAPGSKNSKRTNVTGVKVKKYKYTLKKGQTRKIKARLVLQNPDKKPLKHTAKFRYATSNAKVAKVNKKGKITVVGKGKCTIYVYAVSGVSKKIKVIVK